MNPSRLAPLHDRLSEWQEKPRPLPPLLTGAVAAIRLAELVAALVASHPWELPVIELCEVQVLAPVGV